MSAFRCAMMIGRLPGTRAPSAISVSSPNGRPISCRPIGRPRARPAGRDHQHRQAEIVHRPHEARDRLDHGSRLRAAADIGFVDRRRRRARGRRDDDIDVADRREMRRRAPARASAAPRDIRPRCRRARSRAGCAPAAHSRRRACAATARGSWSPRRRARSARRPRPRSGRAARPSRSWRRACATSSMRVVERRRDVGLEIVDIEARSARRS